MIENEEEAAASAAAVAEAAAEKGEKTKKHTHARTNERRREFARGEHTFTGGGIWNRQIRIGKRIAGENDVAAVAAAEKDRNKNDSILVHRHKIHIRQIERNRGERYWRKGGNIQRQYNQVSVLFGFDVAVGRLRVRIENETNSNCVCAKTA